MNPLRKQSVALLYPGDRAMRDRSEPAESRFAALFDALREAGVTAQPAVYHDDFEDEVEAQLRQVSLVQVWCNPIDGSSKIYNTPVNPEPICVANRIRWASPPDKVSALRSKVK